MKTFKMYGGDKARTPDLQPQQAAGEGITYEVTTAKECFDIFKRCVADGRFPGETSLFKSFSSKDSVLLGVLYECMSMEPFTVHMDLAENILMLGATGYVVGFVYHNDVVFNGGYFGLAYIGG